VRLREIITLARGFRFLRVFVANSSKQSEEAQRLSGNFNLLKVSLFNKGLPFRARQSQSGLPLISNPDLPRPGRKGDLVNFDFEHAYWQQGPIYGPCCYCACMNKSLGIYLKQRWISIVSSKVKSIVIA